MAKELAAIIRHAKMVEITSKADSRDRHRDEFKAALSAFLTSLANTPRASRILA